MFDSIIWFIFVVLILLGTVAICYLIMLKLLLPKTYNTYYVLLPCDENSIDVRKRTYGMRIKLNFINEDINSKIVVLDYGMNNDEKEDLLNICKECNGIYYVKNEYLRDFLDGRI
jgi:hypothetical protein